MGPWRTTGRRCCRPGILSRRRSEPRINRRRRGNETPPHDATEARNEPDPTQWNSDPADPVVSANATNGIATTAAPTPSATASAPTRPTELEEGIARGLNTVGLIGRTCLTRTRSPWNVISTLDRMPAPSFPASSFEVDICPDKSGAGNNDLANSVVPTHERVCVY